MHKIKVKKLKIFGEVLPKTLETRFSQAWNKTINWIRRFGTFIFCNSRYKSSSPRICLHFFHFWLSSTLCYIHIFMHVYLFRYISFPRIHSRKEPQDFNFLRAWTELSCDQSYTCQALQKLKYAAYFWIQKLLIKLQVKCGFRLKVEF